MQNDDPIHNNVRLAWQSQTEKPLLFSPEQLERRAHRLETKVRLRNFGEYSAAVPIVIASSYFFIEFHTLLLRMGAVLIATGVAYVIWQLVRHGSATTLPSEALFASSLDFLIRQLKRQRDLLRGIWSWYLLPLLPGLTVFLFGLSKLPSSSGSGFALSESTILRMTVACVIGFALVGAINGAAARRLQREIEFLSSVRDQSRMQ